MWTHTVSLRQQLEKGAQQTIAFIFYLLDWIVFGELSLAVYNRKQEVSDDKSMLERGCIMLSVEKKWSNARQRRKRERIESPRLHVCKMTTGR